MTSPNFDIVIVGAGAAGLTAAIGLTRSGFQVAVVEAAVFPGAENWSGCVYFAENLAHPDILGPEGVEALAWERRLVERGFFATDGHGLLGIAYRDPAAFQHCYTVLRPIYDHHLAQFALRHGVSLLTSTTAESLIRERDSETSGGNDRVIGVCTNRGPLYASLTFLAEGDASYLVTREGYERSRDPRDRPKFLQGIKQVLELPPRAIEQRFGVQEQEGVAYEMLLRNGMLRGKKLRLNMGGFIYTNRQSLSVGLVLPADNLHEHFGGDPNLLMEWFLRLPSLQPWLEDAKQGPFGAKLIRGGGAKEVPILIDNGLAIGGAASGIGVDFPYPNFTGPATAMGLLITQAARKIRDQGGTFTRDELDRCYLQPLQKTHYWQDVEFLRDWPGYVKKTSAFFGPNIDVALGTAYLWTRPGKSLTGRWTAWLNLVRDLTDGDQRAELTSDLRHFQDALRMPEIVARPSLWRLLLHGALNTARDLVGAPRALPAHGEIRLHYSVAGGAEPSGLPPAAVRRWFTRFAPALAAAARTVYTNNTTPLAKKLPAATRLLASHASLTDLARGLELALLAGWRWAIDKVGNKPPAAVDEETSAYFRNAQAATDMTPATANATQAWETRLAQLSYDTVKASHIHVLWPQSLAEKNAIIKAGLWHVCPAHVYEARVSATGQLQVVVNFENCIKCETCWRTSDLVDWGRDGAQRFVYAVHSPVVVKLLADMGPLVESGPKPVQNEKPNRRLAQGANGLTVLKLVQKLGDFDKALAEEPRTVDRDRAAYLEMLAQYALQMARELKSSGDLQPPAKARLDEILELTQKRIDHVKAGRYSWAASDGRQVRFHHLPELLRVLKPTSGQAPPDSSTLPFAGEDRVADAEAQEQDRANARLRERLLAELPTTLWRNLEQQVPLSADHEAVVRSLISKVRSFHTASAGTFFSRQKVLEGLASRDPSLAYRAASHLWALDLAMLAGGACAEKAKRWAIVEEWACLAILDGRRQALFVPARDAQSVLVLQDQHLRVCSRQTNGLTLEPLATLGLRGAGLVGVRAQGEIHSEIDQTVNAAGLLQAWELQSAYDLTAMALGMADYLCQRANDHAASRVQFPGLFHDEDSLDTIGKFGVIKKMLAEMAAGKALISSCSLVTARTDRAALIKAIVAETLGTAPGSIAYNAGQIFGGTGYSEDDTLSKFYRDAAAWRFLGVPNSEIFARHGATLLESWTPDGRQLSRLPDETALFEDITQRQALTDELTRIRRHEAGLIECVNAWKLTADTLPLARAQAAFAEAVARQEGLVLCNKLLLEWTHNALEFGDATEVDIGLLRTWLNMVSNSYDGFTNHVATLREPTEVTPSFASGSPPLTQYADFLKADLPYASGDFLNRPTDPYAPRYVPEMVQTDEFLSKRNKELIDLIQQQFGQPRNGMVYERYLEEQHRPDAADLDFLREHGFMRMPIPKELGGEGRSKADYYLLTVNTHRFADAAISLTIQVNSSLGTTPVLLSRDKDLPKALKDLAAKQDSGAQAAEYSEELGRRREAADLFCRWVASGQISAFALTEPSAGSDTARVGTRAKLRQVAVLAEANCVYRFELVGAKEPRRLLDAKRLEFLAGDGGTQQAAYRFEDNAKPAAICFEEYDYETDACKKRYFIANGQKVYFDDIAQLRQRQGGLWYDYWELTGAKMWITNGRVMGIMVLYAKTEQGVTGFMVDRHAEGLIVGKDEAKMGQNGSPTNELALQAVRVPRENVVGLEGRGQVNALETLNVGRAGLAMSAMSQMVRLCDWSRAFARERYGETPEWIAWRLDQLEQERFIAEAMAHEIIGRFEHKQTKSVRMESAIAKMLVSELFHRSIEFTEEIHGLEGQTQKHLIEKRKRDARILNIYEGTNEIQRFLILKELTDLAASWMQAPPPGPSKNGGQEIDALKVRLRQLTVDAVQLFGPQLWQNPNLQANCFALCDAVAWVAAAETTLGRVAWLTRWDGANADLLATGRRAQARCVSEIGTRLDRFAVALTQLRSGHYAPEVRAASLLLRQKETAPPSTHRSNITRPLSILVVLDPPVPGVPQPHAQGGRLLEPYCVLTDADRAALETALRLRDSAHGAGQVSLQLATVAPASAAPLLREALSLGFDRARLVTTDDVASPDRGAAALSYVLHGEAAFDLVLGGAGAHDAQHGLLARLTAEVLGVPFAGAGAQVAIDTADKIIRLVGNEGEHTRSLPAAVAVEAGLPLRPFTIDGWCSGLERSIDIIPWPDAVEASALEFEEPATVAAAANGELPPHPLLPREASRLVLETAGVEIASPQARAAHVSPGAPAPVTVDTDRPCFAQPNSAPFIVAVVVADGEGKLRPTARRVLEAAQFLTPFVKEAAKAVLLMAPPRAEAQLRALSELSAMTPFDICVLPSEAAEASDELRCRLLVECWSGLEHFPAGVVAEPWAEAALVALATASGTVDPIGLRVRLLDRHQGQLVAEGSWAGGKLRTRQKVSGTFSTIWVGLAAEAEVGAATPPEPRPQRRIERWSPRLERFLGREDIRKMLQELKHDAGLARLSDAEFIIDVGFGVANRDGYETVIEPLERELRRLGVRSLTIGGSRKVTEELHLLPADRQIGQSGVSVNPRVLLAIGISGAPQHLNYIGPRASILAFNRDPEAPLLTLNQRQARPRVYPVIGDLFETVPALVACLQEEHANGVVS